ncbi:uncharacterized protein LOC120265582 [Dioscorea cayenensis subsp. rotundata]|uniref:Uncharacterized protein LOC120265582 n=1 Tax=Dioscorea cayennensis subsp. rotundata TaxID=55577 RepID=A0AB40BPX8_DIOCR|nr:uncharacterized protein LOC120265582 [Dioscorea cayenensis subsp. rotundata]
MTSIKLSYTKLSKSYESSEQEEDDQVNNKNKEEEEEEEEEERVVKRSSSSSSSSSSRIRWLRLRSSGNAKRFWRRPRVRIARLRRVLKRKVKVVRNAVDKVITRLKQGKPFFGELFAGNYMFMQVSPSPTILMPLTNKSMDKLKVIKLNNGRVHLSLQ